MSGLPDWSPPRAGTWRPFGREAEDDAPSVVVPAQRRTLRRRPAAPRVAVPVPAADPVTAALESGIVPVGEVLGAAELMVLLGAVAEQAGLWQDLADLEREGSDGRLLHLDDVLEVRLIRWQGDERTTGWHDHDRSAAAVRVLLGALVERPLGEQDASLEVRIGSGAAYPYEPEHVHRLDPVVAGTLSLHAWSPPVEVTGHYWFDHYGRLRRSVVEL